MKTVRAVFFKEITDNLTAFRADPVRIRYQPVRQTIVEQRE
jgi:hypothetical protein